VTPLKIEESLLLGKANDPALCEDAIVVNDHFVAVIDGATSLIERRPGQKTPGRKAVDSISQTIANIAADVDAYVFFRALNAALLNSYHAAGTYEQVKSAPHKRSSAAVVAYSRKRSEVWLVSDCQALIDDTFVTSSRRADVLLSEVRSMFLESELLNGKTIDELRVNDTGREYIETMLVRQKRFQNIGNDNPLNYYVLDGFLKDVQSAVQITPVPQDCSQIVLASDGYPYLKPTLKESETALHRILDKDPLCFREYKSTKGISGENISFDDRAYIRFRPN
jgi:glycerophosphoryl diester phosphodiesterase